MLRRRRPVLPWALGGCLLGVVWFFYNYALPPLYKGRICCDSVEYIALAQNAANVKEVLLHSGDRTLGYPLFLWLNKSFVQLLGLGSDWVAVSLISALAVHFAAVLFVYWVLIARLKTKLSPLFLLLTLAHPGLASHAALPLTDSLATSLCAVALGFAMWAYEDGLRARTKFLRHALAGGLVGACILVRPSFMLVALVGAPTLWLLLPAIHHARADAEKTGRARVRALGAAARHYLLPALVGLVLVSAIGFRNCVAKYHVFCVSNPLFNSKNLAESMTIGLDTPRVYTTFTPPRTRTARIKDPFSVEHFGARCSISRERTARDLAGCYARNPPYAAVHLVKQTMALFDNFHLNTYAADITRPWHLMLNRIFGWLGFLGWLCSLHYLYSRLRYRDTSEPHLLVPMAFALLYVGIFINFHVETRYGFPAIAPCLIMLARATQSASRRAKCVLLACSALFWIQTFAWDGLQDSSLL